MWSYIDLPSSNPPENSMELIAWTNVNDCIVSTPCGIIEDSLVQEVKNLTTVKEVWSYLKSKTHQGGIISKLTTLQGAIHICFTSATSINPTLTDIKDLIANLYDE
jgi:hypothetical protein